ncbi:phosphoribosylamine--glycine ligase [Clostridium amylolyticum]|uniref:Phosphoribosylamine--glycine ligase n=1 Tax=Clostridium amylolyticum TaxID=1121298 RepID=A0A1M6IN56_9CLOT|nr:phosphoribosylamine--glycine ligase [Clostridium amylolyticum]SHJ35789.1 phosphoribosylamine--glycine ligase [Clostridium amylolyticum]
MKVLIIGSGGREHALAWKVSQNSEVTKIYCAPGNGGTALENKCENINITEIKNLVQFAKNENIHLTIVGPEEPLTKGIVDEFKKEKLKIFGPDKNSARLEGSKVFSKNFMKKYGVKTASYESFNNAHNALLYIESCEYPIVIKADGLAAGKGVVICQSKKEAKETIDSFMVSDIFHGAGNEIVIEEFIEGVEASILSITDGQTIIPFISAKDHKQIYEGGLGPNTGGMGVIAPNPYVDEEVMKAFYKEILLPTMKGIQGEAMDYKGIIFFGIMISKKGVYLLEYNVRMGDPETQALMCLLETDIIDMIKHAIDEDLEGYEIKWKNLYSCSVIAASGGYPGNFKRGFEININSHKGKIFISGAKLDGDKLITSGGRVLSITATGKNIGEARTAAYEALNSITFNNIYFRKDIGIV